MKGSSRGRTSGQARHSAPGPRGVLRAKWPISWTKPCFSSSRRHGIPLPVDNGTVFRSLWHGTLLPQARHSAPGGTAFRSRRHGITLPVARHSAPEAPLKNSENLNRDNKLRPALENTNLLLISSESVLCRSLHNSPPKGGKVKALRADPPLRLATRVLRAALARASPSTQGLTQNR